ncbi:MAG: DEAD/DEAH box helicase [Gammaproteobacteria bacterium]|nr:DEAD/DEAH box helicase [Gammaproteobacteria bacterium]
MHQKFDLLHDDVKRWIWNQKWSELRDIQEKAIEPILTANCDIIITASTAMGKTEAAFLPACSRILQTSQSGLGILYISPLKALINDQYRRFESFGEILDLKFTPWHGDVSNSTKVKLKKNPSGILLITPESLESLLLNQPTWCSQSFANLEYIIIDEFHVFIGTERGCQLQSLMHRIEFLIQKDVPRIALSATLSQIEKVVSYLRPDRKLPCEIIESKDSSSEVKLQLRGYTVSESIKHSDKSYYEEVTNDLYKILRGKSHLIFANNRKNTELLSVALSEMCKANSVPNEFYTHHGSLSKQIREDIEIKLQRGNYPTSAICTMTLELGIDIGSVDSIAQISAPHSVASLRQRLGRSGRRGEASILRIFNIEKEASENNTLQDNLHLEMFKSIAMINLLLDKWYEPPEVELFHFSTLAQQTLSVIAQYGGVKADQLWLLLCKTGVFNLVNQSLFTKFLKVLGKHDLILQTEDGQLIIGVEGEKLIGHYSFYSAFKTPEEYRLEHNGRLLGMIPIDMPLMIGQQLIFSGKNWKILSINEDIKLINLAHASGGYPPIFNGESQNIHSRVRQEMLKIYSQNKKPIYLDKNAEKLFKEGVSFFNTLALNKVSFISDGGNLHLFTWLGDKIVNTITALIRKEGLRINNNGGIVSISDYNIDSLSKIIKKILNKPKITAFELANCVADTKVEKYDYLLPREIRNLQYGSKFFDIDGAYIWLTEFIDEL